MRVRKPRRGRKVKRDKNGRWVKGTPSPNESGRPRRPRSSRKFDPTDIIDFMNQKVELNGGATKKTRLELLYLKMFEDAVKGRVSNQRYLKATYDEAATALGEARMRYSEMVMSWIVSNQNLANPAYNIPADALRHMNRLFALLRNRYPEEFPEGMTPENMTESFRDFHRERKARREGSR